MPLKPLDVREWLERERQSGLPHADFAAEALRKVEAYDGRMDEDDFRIALIEQFAPLGVLDCEATDHQILGVIRMFCPTG